VREGSRKSRERAGCGARVAAEPLYHTAPAGLRSPGVPDDVIHMSTRAAAAPSPSSSPASTPPPTRGHRPRDGWFALGLCAALLVMYAAIGWSAVRTKSATFDEPVSAVGAWTNLRRFDYRTDFEHPPLWKYLAAFPNGPDALSAADTPAAAEQWQRMIEDPNAKWGFTGAALYGSTGVESHAFVMRSRAVMLAIAAASGALAAWWAWQLGGRIAAVVAALLFALDPNFLAHGPLVKNDAAMALMTLAVACAAWRVGRRATPANVAALALLCAASLVVKFTALLLGPAVAVALVARALMREPWRIFRWILPRRWQRLLAAVGIGAACLLVTFVGIWAAYGFRFEPTPEPGVRLNIDGIRTWVGWRTRLAEHPDRPVTPEEFAAWRPGAVTRAALWANERELLPQAWLAGLLFTQGTATGDRAYLHGERSMTGWWYYFPLAMLYKTPVTTLLAVALAVWVLARHRTGLADDGNDRSSFEARWAAASLIVPFAIVAISALTGRLNLGVRYVLPLYPLAYVGVGVAASIAWARWRRAVLVTVMLAAALAIETAAAFPDYLAFFNVAAGGSRGGIGLLGDSNLDWGQDLPALARWQRRNPDRPLYLSYFGSADPRAYGVRAIDLHSDDGLGILTGRIPAPRGAVVAISATNLQGIHSDPPLRALMDRWRHRQPIDVLGGSIYLYDAAALFK
jgi:hypothetical protein